MCVAVLEPNDNESDDNDREILWTNPSVVSQETPIDVESSADLNNPERQAVIGFVK